VQVPPSSTVAVAEADSPLGQTAVAVFEADVAVPGTVAGFGPDQVTVAPSSDVA
jgi:hypothetical protein